MGRFEDKYVKWRQLRCQYILKYYGINYFNNKTVLELGCGHADIGAFFSLLGAGVHCVDARPEHIRYAKKKYPHMTYDVMDLDKEWPNGRYDMILHMGTLYHLKDPVQSLINACNSCYDLVLETEVVDSNDPNSLLETVEWGYDQAFSCKGSRMSPSHVEKIITNNHAFFTRIEDRNFNLPDRQYAWNITDSNKCEGFLRKFWFVRCGAKDA